MKPCNHIISQWITPHQINQSLETSNQWYQVNQSKSINHSDKMISINKWNELANSKQSLPSTSLTDESINQSTPIYLPIKQVVIHSMITIISNLIIKVYQSKKRIKSTEQLNQTNQINYIKRFRLASSTCRSALVWWSQSNRMHLSFCGVCAPSCVSKTSTRRSHVKIP